jgi:hypothetical protein
MSQARLSPHDLNRTSSSTFLPWSVAFGDRIKVDESFSPVVFIYGLAIVLGVGKACTLLIWRTLPRPRPGLRQELREAWQRRTLRTSRTDRPDHLPVGSEPQGPAPEPAAPDKGRQP